MTAIEFIMSALISIGVLIGVLICGFHYIRWDHGRRNKFVSKGEEPKFRPIPPNPDKEVRIGRLAWIDKHGKIIYDETDTPKTR